MISRIALPDRLWRMAERYKMSPPSQSESLITGRDASRQFAASAIKPAPGNLKTKTPEATRFRKVSLSSR
jgi:hypothetical protein